MKPWTSDPLPKGAARKLRDWWQGRIGTSGKTWSAEIRLAGRGLYIVRVW